MNKQDMTLLPSWTGLAKVGVLGVALLAYPAMAQRGSGQHSGATHSTSAGRSGGGRYGGGGRGYGRGYGGGGWYGGGWGGGWGWGYAPYYYGYPGYDYDYGYPGYGYPGAYYYYPPTQPAAPAQAAAPASSPLPHSFDLSVDFETGSAVLTPAGKQTLDQLGQQLTSAQLSADRFRIEGHTDTVGSKIANLTLSQQRADAVAAYLETQYNITPSRLEAIGVGENDLLIPTPDQTPELRNRRVHVVNLST